MAPKITIFREQHFFLSNFYPSDETLPPTLEHWFQAAKTDDHTQQQQVMAAKSAGDAKRLGKSVTLRLDWDRVKTSVMRDLLGRKFVAGSELARLLVATEGHYLIEGNTHHDKTWGAVWDTRNICWHGENRLGLLLMERRALLQGAPFLYTVPGDTPEIAA
jgi:ribA/ribD-fused uncharacterized protein